MSTRIVPYSTIAQVASTIASYGYEECENPDCAKQAIFQDMHEVIRSLKNHEELEINGIEEVEKHLYGFMLAANQADFVQSYPDRERDEVYWEAAYEHANRGGFTPYPDSSAGMATLLAMLEDINYNSTVSPQNALAVALNDFQHKLAGNVLKLQPAYSADYTDLDQTALSLISLRAYGDKYYCLDKALSSMMDGFEFYFEGTPAKVWGDDYFAALLKQLSENERPIKLPLKKNSAWDEVLPTLKSLTSHPIKITRDIPDATPQMALQAAGVFHAMQRTINNLSHADFVDFQGNPWSPRDFENLKSKMDKFVRTHDSHLSSNLPDYKRAIDKSMGKDTYNYFL